MYRLAERLSVDLDISFFNPRHYNLSVEDVQAKTYSGATS